MKDQLERIRKRMESFNGLTGAEIRTDVERLVKALEKAIEQRNDWMNAFYDDPGLIIHVKGPEADKELEAILRGES